MPRPKAARHRIHDRLAHPSDAGEIVQTMTSRVRFAPSPTGVLRLRMRSEMLLDATTARPAQADETQRYIRLAYSGISVDDIEEGLGKLAAWAGAA